MLNRIIFRFEDRLVKFEPLFESSDTVVGWADMSCCLSVTVSLLPNHLPWAVALMSVGEGQ